MSHDLANHVLAIQLRVQELLADPGCMQAQKETIRTLDRLSNDARVTVKELQDAVRRDAHDDQPPSRPRGRKRP